MRIYLAGPMRGKPNFNAPIFRKAAASLRSRGHDVFSPVESTESIYGLFVCEDADGDEALAGIDGRVVYAADLNWLCRNAEAVALLPGWERSLGARAERAAAEALGLEICELEKGIGDDYWLLRPRRLRQDDRGAKTRD